MNKDNYKICIPLDDIDNAWMTYYDKLWENDKNTEADDRKHDRLGYKYIKDEDGWYFQWCNEEKRYYCVVDKR